MQVQDFYMQSYVQKNDRDKWLWPLKVQMVVTHISLFFSSKLKSIYPQSKIIQPNCAGAV